MARKAKWATGAEAEIYTPQRKAESLLSNAVGRSEYRKARKEVWQMGLDPDSIPHAPP